MPRIIIMLFIIWTIWWFMLWLAHAWMATHCTSCCMWRAHTHTHTHTHTDLQGKILIEVEWIVFIHTLTSGERWGVGGPQYRRCTLILPQEWSHRFLTLTTRDGQKWSFLCLGKYVYCRSSFHCVAYGRVGFIWGNYNCVETCVIVFHMQAYMKNDHTCTP